MSWQTDGSKNRWMQTSTHSLCEFKQMGKIRNKWNTVFRHGWKLNLGPIKCMHYTLPYPILVVFAKIILQKNILRQYFKRRFSCRFICSEFIKVGIICKKWSKDKLVYYPSFKRSHFLSFKHLTSTNIDTRRKTDSI